ncbi:site-specific integrase [Streptomyces sp. NBC_01619]|uniref:tyrosine-type recombinase/integrase n=1 Tax=Streptomyces sp. NBC_01619 TaxID=2975901 RepID=UPI00225B39C5|nr:tyrosine-type recombinase/integrase [Streptomyces sp. NBC_01619]MCX4516039.1 site-specific integrase [Streptomyces sp. NBC_01619]
MARQIVIGTLRVQEIRRAGDRRSWTIVWPEGTEHREADGFLRKYEDSGTQRTYAYALVDHLRWLERECLPLETVTLRDLERYMGIVGAEVLMPLGEPWRLGKKPYGKDALSVAAACLKGFYLHRASLGVNAALGMALNVSRLPTWVDRDRVLLGHVIQTMPSKPLAPKRPRRRHPKMLPEGAREGLISAVNAARDRMTVDWLSDGGFRIGELCGLHLPDLHLREGAACGECRAPHVHICHRIGNSNQAAAKAKYPWSLEDGMITGGLIKRVSPQMLHSYFDYMTSEYPRDPAHDMLMVQSHGPRTGQPWATAGARRMLGRASIRAGLGKIKPHAFRHSFATSVLDASDGNLVVARDAGGWASTQVLDEIYAHVDLHDPHFVAALDKVWGLS